MATWKLKTITVKRVYAVTDAPDLQDTGKAHRMVLRPRTVTLRLIPQTNLVFGAVIEGRQVRRDGELAASKMILAGKSTDSWGYSSTPPQWLNDILTADQLEWTVNTPALRASTCTTV
jgi:hypothetical protein